MLASGAAWRVTEAVSGPDAFTEHSVTLNPKLKGRDIMVVADEDVAKLYPSAPAFAWIYDITNERQPLPILKVLYRNSEQIQQYGGAGKKTLREMHAAEEAAVSRLYGGIHYRFGNDNGLAAGICIGRAAAQIPLRS